MQPSDGWTLAARLEAHWLREPGRIDWLLENHAADLPPIERARCQERLSAAVRHHRRISAALGPYLRRAPKPKLLAILHVAAAEIIEESTAAPEAIVDFAVGKARELCSKAEAGMVNAVLRKAVPVLRAPAPDSRTATTGEIATHFSHPDWLVERWFSRFGRAQTIRLLEWDQTPAAVHLRLLLDAPAPVFVEPTLWPGFFRLKPGHWPEAAALLESGKAYVQDPATRLAPEALDPAPGATVLDLCAAPGGKSLLLAGRLGPEGIVVCVDRPGPRIERLGQNVARFRAANPAGARIEIVAADVPSLTGAALAGRSLPSSFDAVLLDVPCSNTGVLRHRIDARWRLKPDDPATQAAVQLNLLRAAATFVAPGGRLVYSTCSLEPEENSGVVDAFLAAGDTGFALVSATESRPWETGHDGAGVFLLRRN